MDVADWIEDYRRAWETADADLVLTLFTEDASYRANPFEEPHRGHDAIRAYWESVTAGQRRGSRPQSFRALMHVLTKCRRVEGTHALKKSMCTV